MTINPVRLVLVALAASLPLAAQANCPADPILRVDTQTLDMQEKKPVCVPSPGEFRIRIKPAAGFELDPEAVSVEEKEDNEHKGEIRNVDIVKDGPFYDLTVRVDAGFPPGSEPGYEIEIEGVGELDPRVRVSNNRTLMSVSLPQYPEVEATLNDTFRVTTEDVVAIERYLRENDLSAADLLRLTDDHDAKEMN